MLNDLKDLFTSFLRARAPQVLPRQMNPLYHRPTQAQNYDAEYVASIILDAQNGDITPLLLFYRDMESACPTIMSAIATRKLAVMGQGFNIVPPENSGSAGQKVADAVKAMLERSDGFVDACTWLLHGTVWPASIVERRWMPGTAGEWSHPEFRLVPLELFDFTQRTLRLKDIGTSGQPLTTTHPPAANRYIVHRGHMLLAPDNWGGPLRALVFWFLFATQDREWWARFLERFGAPFLTGYYDRNDEESRALLERAFQEATRIFGIVATKETQVQISEASGKADASSAFQMFHDTAKKEMLLVILGQTLSGNSEATGLGSGNADLQGQVRTEYKLWDAFKLGQTIRSYVIKPWMRLNGIDGPVPQITFGGVDPAMFTAMAGLIKAASDAGLELEDDSIQVFNRQAGMNFRRKAAPAPGGFGGQGPFDAGKDPALALAAAGLPPVVLANESISSGGSAELARAISGDMARLGEIVATSRNRTELFGRLAGFLPTYRPHQSQPVIEADISSHAGNALITHGKDPQD